MNARVNKDLSITLTSFFMKFAGFWLAADREEQRRRDFALIYTVSTVSFAIWVETRDFYYSWGNFSDCTYTACNVLTLVLVLYKVFILSVHRQKFINLILYTQRNFWHSNYDAHEKEITAECKRTCTYFICFFTFFAVGTVTAFAAAPIIENYGRNESDRMLPFNMWLDLPLSMTPYFEIMFVIQVLCLYHVGICYFCFDNFLCIMNIHVSGQFRILQYRIKTLCGIASTDENADQSANIIILNDADKCYEAFKKCVRQHQTLIAYCERLEGIFSMIVLGQVLVFSLLICLVGYQVLLAEAPPIRRLIFLIDIIGTLIQLIMFTYSCDRLIEQSSKVGNASYSIPWMFLPRNKTSYNLRRDIIMMIIRSRKTCCLTANGFFPVSLETYTAVLSTAMSYFTLLRQSSADVRK